MTFVIVFGTYEELITFQEGPQHVKLKIKDTRCVIFLKWGLVTWFSQKKNAIKKYKKEVHFPRLHVGLWGLNFFIGLGEKVWKF